MSDSTILSLLSQHEAMRSHGINLVVSENHLSERVRAALASDLAGRYHTSWYGGSRMAQKIVHATEELAKTLFRADHALITAQSGNLCDVAALFAFTQPGDTVAMLPFDRGGYPFGLEKFMRKRLSLPVMEPGFEIDILKACPLIVEAQPALTFLGGSCIQFPHPVSGISGCIRASVPSGVCAYDGSHVLGLIACGAFQDPLREGADLLLGSTHKTFFGPQGGLIVTNNSELADMLRRFLDFNIEEGIGLVDNPHVNRIAALGLALEEMLEDPGYGARVVRNARSLAAALDHAGVPVRFGEKGYTASHQVLLDLSQVKAQKLCGNLEEAGIFIDIGGRIGAAEVTRRGMEEREMKEIAALMAEVYIHEAPGNVKDRVRKLACSS
ncbi:MAG: hypothetical protein ABIK28_08935 [Planctomycetota bacterium]